MSKRCHAIRSLFAQPAPRVLSADNTPVPRAVALAGYDRALESVNGANREISGAIRSLFAQPSRPCCQLTTSSSPSAVALAAYSRALEAVNGANRQIFGPLPEVRRR